jgi:hypothetical protein
MHAGEQRQHDEQEVEFGFRNNFGFGFPYFDDSLFLQFDFCARPLKMQLKRGINPFWLEKVHLILHLKFHLTGSLEAVTGQCVALNRAHLDTTPGARPSGRIKVRASMDKTIGLWTCER